MRENGRENQELNYFMKDFPCLVHLLKMGHQFAPEISRIYPLVWLLLPKVTHKKSSSFSTRKFLRDTKKDSESSRLNQNEYLTYCPENIINVLHLFKKILVCFIVSMLNDSRAFDCLTSLHLTFLNRTRFYMELSHLWVNNGIDNSKAMVVEKSTLRTLNPDLGEGGTHFYTPS